MACKVKADEVEVLQRRNERLISVCCTPQTVDEENCGTGLVSLPFVVQLAGASVDMAVRRKVGRHCVSVLCLIAS